MLPELRKEIVAAVLAASRARVKAHPDRFARPRRGPVIGRPAKVKNW